MRILMLTSSWPLHEGDFRGGFVREMALDFASRGIFVEVAVPAPRFPVPHGFNGDGRVAVHFLPSAMPFRSGAFHGDGIENNLLRHPLSGLSLPPFLAAFAIECSVMLPFVDAIVSNWLVPMGAVGMALSAVSGRPHLVIAHSGPPAPALVPPLSNVVRKIVGSSVSVACVSESVRRKTLAVAGDSLAGKLCVIPLGVSLQPFVDNARPANGPLRVMFAGRLVSFKGLDILIRALRGVENCTLTVVGDGPTRKSMEALAALLGISATFCGAVPGTEVRRRMSQSDVLVVPSRRGVFGREEGLPRVLTEAWSVGLPVIASRSGGIQEAVEGTGAGLLFEPGDIDALRSRLREIRSDHGLLTNLRHRALEAAGSFSWDRAGPRWASWIESALNRGG